MKVVSYLFEGFAFVCVFFFFEGVVSSSTDVDAARPRFRVARVGVTSSSCSSLIASLSLLRRERVATAVTSSFSDWGCWLVERGCAFEGDVTAFCCFFCVALLSSLVSDVDGWFSLPFLLARVTKSVIFPCCCFWGSCLEGAGFCGEGDFSASADLLVFFVGLLPELQTAKNSSEFEGFNFWKQSEWQSWETTTTNTKPCNS